MPVLPLDTIEKLVIAAVLGAILGAERDITGRPAGLRTNMLIAVSSCLFTLLSTTGFDQGGGGYDPSRIASQIVTGVGFLGAGALIHNRNQIIGLTTAADIWLVAAVGMAVGIGWYAVAVFATLFCVAALILLKPLSHAIDNLAVDQRTSSARRSSITLRRTAKPKRRR